MAEEKRIGLTLEHLISKHNDYMITTDINNNTSVKIYRTKKLNNGSRVTGSSI